MLCGDGAEIDFFHSSKAASPVAASLDSGKNATPMAAAAIPSSVPISFPTRLSFLKWSMAYQVPMPAPKKAQSLRIVSGDTGAECTDDLLLWLLFPGLLAYFGVSAVLQGAELVREWMAHRRRRKGTLSSHEKS
jgi:hypothetical protein